MVVDQFSDPQHRLLFQLKKEYPREVLRAKTASLDGTDVPSTAYADQDRLLFPLHTPEHALLSKLYATKQAAHVGEEVMRRIDGALDVYGVEWSEPSSDAEKTASETDASHYLLPQYQALLVKEAGHVPTTAEALLAQRYKLTTPTLIQAATGLVKKAAAFGLSQRDIPRDVYKYAGLTTCDVGVLADWLEVRACSAPTLELRQDYEKIAKHVCQNVPIDGVLRDRDELIKIAGIVERLDNESKFAPRYGRTMLDPVETVFNMDKVATPTIDLAGNKVSVQKLMALPDTLFEEILGGDVLQHASVDGQTDPKQFAAVLQTLPRDLQQVLYNSAKAYL